MLEGAFLDRREQSVDIGDQEIGGTRQLHGKTGVEHVGTGHALMHEARIGADEFGEMRQEGDHVVLGDAFDLVDALNIEGRVARLVPDRLGALLRDDPDFGERVAGVRLDLEPDFEARPRLPNIGHRLARVARDHVAAFGFLGKARP